jgi:hypothetical protein
MTKSSETLIYIVMIRVSSSVMNMAERFGDSLRKLSFPQMI